MKNKFLIFTLISIIVVSIFAVPCFALTYDSEQEYTFKEDLNPSMFNMSSAVTLDVLFAVRDNTGIIYHGMTMYYRGYYALAYDNGQDEITVWTSDSGWSNEKYREIIFAESVDIGAPFSVFLENNEHIESFSVYGTIYNLISEHLFNGFMEDSFVRLAVTLVSVILALVSFAFPFGVVYMVFKMILTAIDRSI